jgi:Yip1 domain
MQNQHFLLAALKRLQKSPTSYWDFMAGQPVSYAAAVWHIVVPLALIGPVFGLFYALAIQSEVFLGTSYPVFWYQAVIAALLNYIATLVVFFSAAASQYIAPYFHDDAQSEIAPTLLLYSLIPYWLAGVWQLLPNQLYILNVLGVIYAMILFYFGTMSFYTMKPEKRIAFMVASFTLILVLSVITNNIYGRIGSNFLIDTDTSHLIR